MAVSSAIPTLSNMDTLQSAVRDSLSRWWQASQSEIFQPDPQRRDLVYGTGYNTWGVQTQQKALGTAALLMHQGDELAARQAVDLLRFNLNSHLEGDYTCTDTEQWGHTWISVLGIERMMFAIDLIHDELPQDLQQQLRTVLISEADWLLNDYAVVAGLVDNNKPESNIWNGAILHRVAMMYPDCPNAAAYKQKGDAFLYNGISIESDLENPAFKEMVVGANFFESMALDHHHYLNVGYMVICLSNIAMLHFSYKTRGLEAPESLYHHADKLWQLIKFCTFDDGRLWRIGGDTRVRYCYCQDYALPMWLFIEDYYKEDCSTWIDGWVQQVLREQDYSGNDSYLGKRLERMRRTAPLYYTRLESDRACSMAMTAAWLPLIERDQLGKGKSGLDSWSDAYHCSFADRNEQRMVSWTWHAGEGPTGTCVPVNASDMAEWGVNLFPLIKGTGDRSGYKRIKHDGALFAGGFITSGQVQILDHGIIGEGSPGNAAFAEARVMSIALPDGCSNLIVQYVCALTPHYITEIQGLHLKMPNDVWNNGQRRLDDGRILSVDSHDAVETGRNILRFDDALQIQALYQHSDVSGEAGLSIRRHAERSVGLRHLGHCQVQRSGGFLQVEEVALPLLTTEYPQRIAAGSTLVDCAALISCGEMPVYTMHRLEANNKNIRMFHLQHADTVYLVAFNISDDDQEIAMQNDMTIVGSVAYDSASARLAGGACLLARL